MPHRTRYGQANNSDNMNLRARRAEARLKQMGLSTPRPPARKILNMRWINDTLDQVILELGEYSTRETEIAQAADLITQAKRLISGYGSKVLNQSQPLKTQSNQPYGRPYQTKPQVQPRQKGKYDDYNDNHGFDDAGSVFQQQHDAAAEEELEGIYEGIEHDTDEKLRGQGVEPCRDDEGHFTDC